MTSDCVVLLTRTRCQRQLVTQTTHKRCLFALFAGPRSPRRRTGRAFERLVGGAGRRCLSWNPPLKRELGSSLCSLAVLDSPRSRDGTAGLDPFTDLSSTRPSPRALHGKVRIVNGLAPSCPLP